jgi:hypothetical protein
MEGTPAMILPKVRRPVRRAAMPWGRRAPDAAADVAGRLECRWQRDQLPAAVRELVLDDQRLRNDICWSVFDC